MAAAKPQREHKPPRRLRDKVGHAWIQRKPIKGTGQPRFVKVEDPMALMLMRCAFDHAVTFALLWAIMWRTETENHRTVDSMTGISSDELIEQTGYSRAGVFRGLIELKDRGMIQVETGGGAHRSSRYRLTAPDEWLL